MRILPLLPLRDETDLFCPLEGVWPETSFDLNAVDVILYGVGGEF